jgi:hypothetical protein
MHSGSYYSFGGVSDLGSPELIRNYKMVIILSNRGVPYFNVFC